MAVKTKFSRSSLVEILSNYNLGEYKSSKPLTAGTIQINILLQTAKGKFVFRYYRQGRSKDSVLFEVNLIKYLKKKKYPCPNVFKNKQGKLIGIYNKKPYAVFEFIEGEHLKNLDNNQQKQLIKKVAELHNITKNYRPFNKKHRWNYDIKLCRKLAQKEAKKINTENSRTKLKWYQNQLFKLRLPKSLPKGVCHGDFDLSNILFKNNKFNALIDWDDANYTYFVYDLVELIEYSAWPWSRSRKKALNLNKARKVISEYMKYRDLNNNEKRHLFDVFKLSILIDCIWFFKRGNVKDFNEKRKIDYLDSLGREKFYQKLFT